MRPHATESINVYITGQGRNTTAIHCLGLVATYIYSYSIRIYYAEICNRHTYCFYNLINEAV